MAECTGVIWAFLLSKTARVRRRDGSKVEMAGMQTWKQELSALWSYLRLTKVRHVRSLVLLAADSFTDLACVHSSLLLLLLWRNHGHLSFASLFSPRARPFITPCSYVLVVHVNVIILTEIACVTIPSVILFGKLLDNQRWSQRRRAWVAFLAWIIPQMGCFIWVAIEYHQLGSKSALDYEL